MVIRFGGVVLILERISRTVDEISIQLQSNKKRILSHEINHPNLSKNLFRRNVISTDIISVQPSNSRMKNLIAHTTYGEFLIKN